MSSNMGGRGSSSGKQVKYNGKQIYVRKNESIDDAIKRYETKQTIETKQKVANEYRSNILEMKIDRSNLPKLKGSEKQVNWANSVREQLLDATIASAKKTLSEINDKGIAQSIKQRKLSVAIGFRRAINHLKKEKRASAIIDDRYYIKHPGDYLRKYGKTPHLDDLADSTLKILGVSKKYKLKK